MVVLDEIEPAERAVAREARQLAHAEPDRLQRPGEERPAVRRR
jgi:hypothetical protein